MFIQYYLAITLIFLMESFELIQMLSLCSFLVSFLKCKRTNGRPFLK